ncbi:MAG: HAMP domain-containing histidine kinase [Chitinophagales bacterium]|nr:HAMP domain-containing histidine kinase [Chitinophagales bacterium]
MQKNNFQPNPLTGLYWRIAAIFSLLLIITGIAYIYITIQTSRIHYEEVNQLLNRKIATHIAEQSNPYENGKINKALLEETFHKLMAINPSLEVYLLDIDGNIISYYAPNKKIILEKISLDPIKRFILTGGTEYTTGDDPRHPGQKKVFSAAPVLRDHIITGYIYAVLTSEEYDAVLKLLSRNYLIKIGIKSIVLTLLATLIIGLILIRIITKNYRNVFEVMQRFKEGDLSARVNVRSKGDVKQLADIYNQMADILTENINKVNAIEMLRRELIANISHDLKTPVSVIQGYAETLQMKQLTLTDSDRNRYINTILQNSRKLEKLVNELFELSKLEANQVEPKKEPFSISELANDMNNKYQLIAKEKNITLETYLSKDLPPVYADVSLIERVMQNLIDNAIKFTPEGGHVKIKTLRYDHHVEIIITDSGIGIPENEKEKIFTRNYRTTDNFIDLKDSAGLGLTIAKKILELHHSSLQLTSTEKSGSSFSFSLPVYKIN